MINALEEDPGPRHPEVCPEGPHCFRCGRGPEETFEGFYGHPGDHYETGLAYCLSEEATYNPTTSHFACDGCYIAIGTPAGPAGWLAP